jgi:hypothetical protein
MNAVVEEVTLHGECIMRTVTRLYRVSVLTSLQRGNGKLLSCFQDGYVND